MTQAAESLTATRAPYIRIVGAISAAHFVSHFYMILLAPLMPFVREEYGVSYTEIGFAFAIFNLVSAFLQTPAGFLVDRIGARTLLIAGLSLGGASFVVAGVVDSFWVLVAMFALAGLANTVYHPADYAALSQQVPASSIGQAFAVHTFAGTLGGAVTPITVLAIASVWGWRGAFIASGILGFAVAALLVAIGGHDQNKPQKPARGDGTPEQGAWALLLSTPILVNLLLFTLIAIAGAGFTNYSVVALGAAHGTPLSTANTALTGHLLLMSIGVLVGGLVVSRTTRYGLVTGTGFATLAFFSLVVGEINLPALVLIGTMSLAGFCYGVIMPSRDMIVREVTPPGSFGKVFGFVTTGFNIGGIAGPLIFGPIMDHGSPRLVFAAVAGFSLIAVLVVFLRPRGAAGA